MDKLLAGPVSIDSLSLHLCLVTHNGSDTELPSCIGPVFPDSEAVERWLIPCSS